ncbi:hypothetical protein FBU30_008294 [Linnemannia zychae]|nr:hypothetical protein FBU30_008294 [Linnemannia zychae]
MVIPDKKLTPFQRSISILKAKTNRPPSSPVAPASAVTTPTSPATGTTAKTPAPSSAFAGSDTQHYSVVPIPQVQSKKTSHPQAPLPSVSVSLSVHHVVLSDPDSPSSPPSSSASSPPSSPSSSTASSSAPSSAPSTPPPTSSSSSSLHLNSSSPISSSASSSPSSSSPSSPSHTLVASLVQQSDTSGMPSNSSTIPVIQHLNPNNIPIASTKQQQQQQQLESNNKTSTNGIASTRAIPSTFITLAGQDQEPSTDDSDDEPIPESAPSGRKRTVTTGATLTGPYLTAAAVGQRSLSTPNLHADNSLIISPANSPPSSPGLPAIASVTDSTNIPALSLDGNSSSSALNEAIALTLSPSASPMASPMASPNSSPRLSPRKPTGGVAPPVGRTKNGERPSNRSSGASLLSSTASTLKQKTPPASDGTKTLKSSKNKSINRNSIVSLFDTGASSMTLPTNFARKGSLPQDAAHQGGTGGLAGLFVTQPHDLTSTPFSLTLAEFRLNDIYPKRQRRLLTVLHRMDTRLRKEGVVKKLTKEQLKGKPDKEVLKPDRKSLNKDYGKKTQGGFMAQRIPAFLRSKKLKKRTRPVILHNIEMAIRDKKPELALQYISLLPSNALKKKKKKSYSDLNHCMLLAMIYRMEQVAVELVERGFPIDVNYPIIGKARDEYKTKAGRTGPFEYPSYFIVAVGLGMCNLVKAMIKNANLNQSWCGLTPLLLATTLNECTNATCPPPTLPPAKLASMLSRGERVHLDMSSQTLISQLPSSFNKSTNTQFTIPGYTPTSPNSIVTTLLEYGADPNLGITLQQYLWANKLKGMGVLSRRRRIPDSQSSPGDNPIEFYIAARRHESGRQWLSHSEIKARKVAKALEAQATGGKKRFSSEMQEYWKGKYILPVELAIASGNLDCARTILQRLGPNSLSSSSFGLLLQNDVMLTLSLIKSGTPVSQHDLHGCTPLHLAARRGHLEMVMVLVQLGGDVNSRGERQWTPLHESMSQNHSNISSLLVACGADLEATNDAGETPADLGRRRGLSPKEVEEHLDATKAKNCSAGLVHSLAHLPSHLSNAVAETRSGASSRRASHEQLTTNTLKSMIISSNNHGLSNERNHNSLDQARHSGHYASNLAGSLGDLNHNGSSMAVGTKSPLSMSQDSLPQQINGNGHSPNSGSGNGGHMPLTPSSSSSSLTGSRSSASSEKKKKVRGFLKKIFN